MAELVPKDHRDFSFAVRAIGVHGLDEYTTVAEISAAEPAKAPGAAIELAYARMRAQFPYRVDTVRCWVVTLLA